jgi:pimeloyl-ACP methyl ester carboxylesterase
MNLVEHIDGTVPFPEGVYRKDIKANDVTIHTGIGGQGPAVVMLHGFATTGDIWAPVASALIDTHTVIAPDLRGLGLSSKPSGGYDKKIQSED